MSEVAKRGSAVTARGVGNTAGAGVAALLTMAGVPGVVSVPVGAFAGSLVEEGVSAGAALWQERAGRVERFAHEAELESSRGLEDLLDAAMQDSGVLEILGRASEVASRSLDDQKIDLLARVFVACVNDPAKVDDAAIVIESLRQLEAPHLRVLRVLDKPGPHLVPARATGEGERTAENMARIHTWRVADILDEDPGLNGAFDALISRLQSLGLVYDEGNGRMEYEPLWLLTDHGRACMQHLSVRRSAEENGSG